MTNLTDLTMPLGVQEKGNARTAAALKRLQQAMADIEVDIAANDGVYPFNHGRLNQSELCRRADVKKATLQNPLHKDTTRVEVIRWLDQLNTRLTQTRLGTRERVTSSTDQLVAQAKRLASELSRTQSKLAEAEQALTELQQENVIWRSPRSTQFMPGTRLRHYKGGLYTVVGSCMIEATLKPGVLYRPLQGDMQDVVWIRPLAEFEDRVPTAEGSVSRFVVVDTEIK